MPNIFKRTVLIIGNGSLAVTLPRPWADYYGLKHGDKVELVTDRDIRIRRTNKKKLEVDRGEKQRRTKKFQGN